MKFVRDTRVLSRMCLKPCKVRGWGMMRCLSFIGHDVRELFEGFDFVGGRENGRWRLFSLKLGDRKPQSRTSDTLYNNNDNNNNICVMQNLMSRADKHDHSAYLLQSSIACFKPANTTLEAIKEIWLLLMTFCELQWYLGLVLLFPFGGNHSIFFFL